MDRDLENRELIDWVRKRGRRADYVISLCDGAFVLAQAGLLDGRAVTTFPADQDRFAEKFPGLDLRREPTFVHDGAVLTSQGGADSYLVAMYLVDHLYGEEVARKVGKGLLIPWRDALRNRAFVAVPPGGSS
jgi:transcriptional regulator GlxA family with amidase domain